MVKKLDNTGRKVTPLEKLSLKVTNWVGTPESIIAHSVFFVGIFALYFFGLTFDKILLVLTTAVSLEAIYLAIFIQMTVNRQGQSIEDIQEDVEDIQEDVEDLSEDVEDINDHNELHAHIPGEDSRLGKLVKKGLHGLTGM